MKDQKKISYTLDVKGNKYATVKNLQQDLNFGNTQSYRIFNRDFKRPGAIGHQFYKLIQTKPHTNKKGAIEWEAYQEYIGLYQLYQNEDNNLTDEVLALKKDLARKIPLTVDSLIKYIYLMNDQAEELQSQADNYATQAAIVKVTNPFKGTFSFVRGKTYEEYKKWAQNHNVEDFEPSPWHTKEDQSKIEQNLKRNNRIGRYF